MKAINLVGEKFGKWLILKRSERRSYWWCRCDCGMEKEVFHGHLKKGLSTSCGCYTHPHKHPAYGIWHGMKSRCYDPGCPNYKNYGAKGIKMCQNWADSSGSFISWVNQTGYHKGLTIERLNVLDDYSPSNCTWILRKEQNWNKRNTIWVEWQGKRQSLAKLAKDFDLLYVTVYKRYSRGWPVSRILLTRKD